MTTQMISQKAPGFLEGSSKSMLSKGSTGSKSFGNIMEQSLSGVRKEQNTAPEIKEIEKPADIQDETKVQKPSEDSKVKEEADAVSGDQSSQEADPAVKAEGEEEGMPELGEEEAGEIKDQLLDMVKDILDLDEEELNSLMAQMGFTTADLLNPDNLKALVLKSNGEGDMSALLTNENLADMARQLTEGVKNLTDQLEVPVKPDGKPVSKEELQFILAKALEQLPKSQTPYEESAEKQLTDRNKDMEGDPDFSAESADAVKITVENHNTEKQQNQSGTDAKGESPAAKTEGKEPDIPVIEGFLKNLTNARINGNPIAGMEPKDVMREIVDQIVEQIKVVIKPETTSMELHLNPEQLGRVHLTVEASKSGEMTASFTVQNEAAKEAIESQIQILKESLDKQGIKVEAVEVTVSDFGFEQGQKETGDSESGKKKAPRRLHAGDILESAAGLSEEEELAARVMEQNGNSVDYTA